MIRKAEKSDLNTLAKLAVKMWDSHMIEELEKEFAEIIKGENSQFFIKYVDDRPIGFAQCQLRFDYVEGTKSSPVGYLEGIFIEEEYRKKGYAKKLLKECESWAVSKGCKEFASDCEINNTGSMNFHLNMGFTEANRIICFTKSL